MLTSDQERRHRADVEANLARADLDHATLADALGFTDDRLDRALAVDDSSDPTDVWLIRDFVDQVIRDRGDAPVPWTVLVHHESARRWFRLQAPPPTPPALLG
jgi:hypothetical protein